MTAVTALLADILIDTRSWGEHANCIGKANVLEGSDVDAAKKLCLGDPANGRPRCPVIDDCHIWVIPLGSKSKPDPGGVRAGRTEEERQQFRAELRRNRPPAPVQIPQPTTRTRPDGWKRCCHCQEYKPPAEFHIHRDHKDGLASHCKPCSTARKLAQRRRKAAA